MARLASATTSDIGAPAAAVGRRQDDEALGAGGGDRVDHLHRSVYERHGRTGVAGAAHGVGDAQHEHLVVVLEGGVRSLGHRAWCRSRGADPLVEAPENLLKAEFAVVVGGVPDREEERDHRDLVRFGQLRRSDAALSVRIAVTALCVPRPRRPRCSRAGPRRSRLTVLRSPSHAGRASRREVR